ncbi:unnamed protein product [Symbiodinium sp. CCMP2592]|nr:unnamed protein product [Symbiodinium sp. CCMP2592]
MVDDGPDLEYVVGLLRYSGVGQLQQTCEVIGLTEQGGKCLVAVPGAVWHKRPPKRTLPKNALLKATALEVAAVSVDDRSEALPGARVDYLGSGPDAAFGVDSLGQALLPHAQALYTAVNDVFAFHSADAMSKIASGFKVIMEREQRAADPQTPPPKFVKPRAKARQKAVEEAAPQARPAGNIRYANLDPGVALAAEEAGVQAEALAEMDRLVGAGPLGPDCQRSQSGLRLVVAGSCPSQDNPKLITRAIANLMAEDLLGVAQPGVPASARAWVEHRSRIGPYQTLAKTARLSVHLLMLDQVALGHLREQMEFAEKREKLSRAKLPAGPSTEQEEEGEGLDFAAQIDYHLWAGLGASLSARERRAVGAIERLVEDSTTFFKLDAALMGRSAVKAEASRLKCPPAPSFSPRGYLDSRTQKLYDRIQLYRALAESGRLLPVRVEPDRLHYAAGMFAVPKDLTRDRLVLDGRPSNALFEPPSFWSSSMASASVLLPLVLRPHESLRVSTADLKDYFYLFRVGRQRLAKNLLKGALSKEECEEVFGHGCQEYAEPDGSVNCESGDRGPALGAERLDSAHASYQASGLLAHPEKGSRDAAEATFWGVKLDGDGGLLRPSPVRLGKLMLITTRVACLGVCTRGLLQSLVGSWTSVFLLRRRTLSLLQICFEALSHTEDDDVIRLSAGLRDELWSWVLAGPLCVADLRAQVLEAIYATDASDDKVAGVQADLPAEVALEVFRHSLQKGAWARLLSEPQAWFKARGLLDEVSMHINLKELHAFLRLEERIGNAMVSVRFLCGLDSQVVLGALTKGRAASPAINKCLRLSLAYHLGCGLYQGLGYFRSAENPADDPTRGVELRKARDPLPAWWLPLARGDTTSFDRWLESRGEPCQPAAASTLQWFPEAQKKGSGPVGACDGESSGPSVGPPSAGGVLDFRLRGALLWEYPNTGVARRLVQCGLPWALVVPRLDLSTDEGGAPFGFDGLCSKTREKVAADNSRVV